MRASPLQLCFLLLTLALGVPSTLAAELRPWMTRAQVEEELGPPVSVISGQTRQVLLYPKGGRVVFEKGHIVEVQHLPFRNLAEGEAYQPDPAASGAGAVSDEEAQQRLSAAQSKTAAAKPGAGVELLHSMGIEHKSPLSEKGDPNGRFERFLNGRDFEGLDRYDTERFYWLSLFLEFFFGLFVNAVLIHFALFWQELQHFWWQVMAAVLLAGVAQFGIDLLLFGDFGLMHCYFSNQVVAWLVMTYVLGRKIRNTRWMMAAVMSGFAKVTCMGLWFASSTTLLRQAVHWLNRGE